MMIDRIVFEIFEDYLKADIALEVMRIKHGYAVMLWDAVTQDWSDVVCCPTPESLFDKLIESAAACNEYLILRKRHLEVLDVERKKEIECIRKHYLKLKEVMV